MPQLAILGLVLALAAPPTASAEPPDSAGVPTTTPDSSSTEDGDVPVVKAHLVTGPGHRDVDSIRRLLDGAGRMAWSRQGDELVYEAFGESGRRHLEIERFDGAGPDCLTCDIPELRDADVLDPVWHPSGDSVLAQVRHHGDRFEPTPLELASPHRGLHSELWLFDRRGKGHWRLTNVRELGGAVVSGAFSLEGNRLAWTERIRSSPEPWGRWRIGVADFGITRGQPRLTDVRAIDPPSPGWVEVHDVTPDDDALVAAVWGPEERATLWRIPFETGPEPEPIFASPDDHEAVAAVAPRSDHVAVASDRGLPVGGTVGAADVWIQELDGSGRQRWTWFNDPQSDHWIEGGAVIDDLAWHPEGRRLAIHLVSRHGDAIWELELDPEWSTRAPGGP